MKASDAHVQHYPEDNPCNRCSFLACRNRPLTYFRQCVPGASGLRTAGRATRSPQRR